MEQNHIQQPGKKISFIFISFLRFLESWTVIPCATGPYSAMLSMNHSCLDQSLKQCLKRQASGFIPIRLCLHKGHANQDRIGTAFQELMIGIGEAKQGIPHERKGHVVPGAIQVLALHFALRPATPQDFAQLVLTKQIFAQMHMHKQQACILCTPAIYL